MSRRSRRVTAKSKLFVQCSREKNRKQHFLDSEWHSFFECPLIDSPRREFILLTKLDHLFERRSSVEQFALLVARVREEKKWVNALARLAIQVQEHRRKWFRQLSTEAKKRV